MSNVCSLESVEEVRPLKMKYPFLESFNLGLIGCSVDQATRIFALFENKIRRRVAPFLHVWYVWQQLAVAELLLILNHQEVVPVKNYNIAVRKMSRSRQLLPSSSARNSDVYLYIAISI
jgi:hypothetical protein